MNPLDLIRGRDSKLVLTKLQAATFHFLLAISVVYVTWKTGVFQMEMWALYSTVAVGHAVFDKSAAQYKDFKDKQLDTETVRQL